MQLMLSPEKGAVSYSIVFVRRHSMWVGPILFKQHPAYPWRRPISHSGPYHHTAKQNAHKGATNPLPPVDKHSRKPAVTADFKSVTEWSSIGQGSDVVREQVWGRSYERHYVRVWYY